MRTLLLTSILITGLSAFASAASGTDPIAHPTSANKVVLRVSTGGGFVAPQTNLRALPAFTLFGNGAVIVPGPVPQLFPGPAIFPLVRTKLSERQVQALLQRARRAGLLVRGPIDYGDMGAVGVSDGPTTTLIVNAGGSRVTRQAYALGIGAGHGRLTAKQVKTREALARFVAGLPRGLAGARYAPRALAVYVAAFQGSPQPGARPVVWPLTRDLATTGKPGATSAGYRCIAIGGADAKTLLATLRRANEQSQWLARAGATPTYQVIARPLLPDEVGCKTA
ncbi:MAG TPA: hypothetical protein VFD90_03050 [Gaiellales bacterium]|jgi:hypothetical protein|nr:hypothetical protein [Gaiellales bacterium]